MGRDGLDPPAPSGADGLAKLVLGDAFPRLTQTAQSTLRAGHQHSRQGSKQHKRAQAAPAAARPCKRLQMPAPFATIPATPPRPMPQQKSQAQAARTAGPAAMTGAIPYPGDSSLGSTITAAHTAVPTGPSASAPRSGAIVPAATMTVDASATAKALGASARSDTVTGSNQGQQSIDSLIQQLLAVKDNPQVAQELLQSGIMAQCSAAVSRVLPSQLPLAIEAHYNKGEVCRFLQQAVEEYTVRFGGVPFNLADLAGHIADGESVNITGRQQLGKTSTIAGAALAAARAGFPHVVIACEANANTRGLTAKIQQQYFDKLNELECVKEAQITLKAVCAGTAAEVRRQMTGDLIRGYQSGHTTLVISYTPEQMNRITDVVEYTKLPILLTFDEADKMWSSLPTDDDDPEQDGLIQRERAFYRLATCLDRRGNTTAAAHHDNMDTDSAEGISGLGNSRALVSRFPALVALVQISATPVDMLRWHMGKELPMRYLAPTELGDNYCGEENLKAFEDHNGQEVFLTAEDVTKANNYGLDPPKCKLSAKAAAAQTRNGDEACKPGAHPAKTLIMRFYDHIADLAAAGRKGLLLLDITCPGVNVEVSTINRAKRLAALYQNFVFLVVTGRGVQEVTAKSGGDGEHVIQQKQAASFTRRTRMTMRRDICRQAAAIQAAEDQESAVDGGDQHDDDDDADAAALDLDLQQQLQKQAVAAAVAPDCEGDEPEVEVELELAAVLRKYDDRLSTPVVVLGYAMTRRSVSIRTDDGVPTHIICAPSTGTSLADFLQMMGRAMGNVRDVLDRHGYDCVRVLCRRDDYQSMQLYYEFVQYLYSERADGSTSGLIRTLEDVPAKFRQILSHKRRQGQKALDSGKFLDRFIQYAELQGAEAAAAWTSKSGKDGRFGGGLHMLMMMFAGASKLLGKERLSYKELRSTWSEGFHAYATIRGHGSAVRRLRRVGVLEHVVNAQGQPQHGVHQLTAAGKAYVEKFADEVPGEKP